MSDQPQNQTPPPFDPSAEHMVKPKLRNVRGFPVQGKRPDGQEQQMLGLADAKQISSKMVVTAPAFQMVLPKMDGSRGLEDIVGEVGQGLQVEMLQQFVAQLDDAGLLEGPTFEKLRDELREQFDKADTLPPGRTADFADQIVMAKDGKDVSDEVKAEKGPDYLRGILDEWMNKALEKADDPSFESLPKAIVAPQGDYQMAWPNYATVYGRMRVVDRPDRIVILGSNNFGEATGVCGCDKGFESPLGLSPVDSALAEKLRGSLGETLFANRFDHEREHSIELQIPWVQHVFGEQDGSYVPIFAALIHDPAVNNGESYDGNGIGLQAFVDALKTALDELGGTTLVVCSADLSHVGPAFGDQVKLAGDDDQAKGAREKVVSTDRELLKSLEENKPDDLVSSMAWQQNPTRWNSTGALVTTFKVAQPEKVRLVNYLATMDQQGVALVSSVAMALH